MRQRVGAVRAFSLLVYLVAAAWLPAGVASAQPALASLQTVSVPEVSPAAIVAEMNRYRAAVGLGPLHEEARLDLAAEDRIHDMESRRYFDHVAPDGMQPWVWVDRHGYRYDTVGENLAVGYRTAAALVSAWMESPEHRENILLPEFRDVGIAITTDSPISGYSGDLVVAIYGAAQ